jgi:hypothetical protein
MGGRPSVAVRYRASRVAGTSGSDPNRGASGGRTRRIQGPLRRGNAMCAGIRVVSRRSPSDSWACRRSPPEPNWILRLPTHGELIGTHDWRGGGRLSRNRVLRRGRDWRRRSEWRRKCRLTFRRLRDSHWARTRGQHRRRDHPSSHSPHCRPSRSARIGAVRRVASRRRDGAPLATEIERFPQPAHSCSVTAPL